MSQESQVSGHVVYLVPELIDSLSAVQSTDIQHSSALIKQEKVGIDCRKGIVQQLPDMATIEGWER